MKKIGSKWFLLLLVSSAIFLSVLDLFIVNVAIPSIKKGIQGSDGDIQLVIILYVIGYAAFLIMGGRAGDYFGKKNVFIIGILIFTLASCACGFAQNTSQLNISRLIQGISAAFMVPQGIAFIPFLFPNLNEREKAFGIYGSIAGTASVIGQFLGGFLPDTNFFLAGWRLIFLINLPLGFIAALLAYKFLPECKLEKPSLKNNGLILERVTNLNEEEMGGSRDKSFRSFDFLGVALFMLALVTFIYPIIRGRELGWPLWTFIMFTVSIPLSLIFLFDQRKRLGSDREPLIDIQLFKNRYFTIGLLTALFYYMVQDSYFLINAIHLQNGLGVSSSLTGFYFVFQGIGYLIASFLSIKLVIRYGKYVLIAGIGTMILSLCFHLVVLRAETLHTAIVLPILFAYGLGCGTVLPTMFTMSLKSISSEQAGAASGVYLTFQQIAIALGVGIIGGVFFYILGDDLNTYAYTQAYQVATLVNIALLIFVGVLCCFFPHKRSTR